MLLFAGGILEEPLQPEYYKIDTIIDLHKTMRYNRGTKTERGIFMKRIIALVLAALMMAAVFTACGGSAKNVDLKSVLDTVNSQFGLEGLKSLDDAKSLNRYYTIGEDEVKQFAGELSTAASQYTEVVMVEGNDADAATKIAAALQAHLDSQLSTAKSYDADQVAMIEGCSVKQAGNYVWLVISDKASDINGVIEAALK